MAGIYLSGKLSLSLMHRNVFTKMEIMKIIENQLQ